MRGKKITFRVDDTQLKKLTQMRTWAGCADNSTLIRRALDEFEKRAMRQGAVESPKCEPPYSAYGTSQSPDPTVVSEPRPTTILDAEKARDTAFGTRKPLPHEVTDLLKSYRAHGMEIRKERKRVFWRLLAAATVACETNENPLDDKLRDELFRIARAFGLLT